MKTWKTLTIENMTRAQCIFFSVGFNYKTIKNAEFLEGTHYVTDIKEQSQKAVLDVRDNKEAEILFSIPCSSRCRMYVYPHSDPMVEEKFPGAEYMIGITNMNHFNSPKEAVEKTFSGIEKALLKEKFPALKF